MKVLASDYDGTLCLNEVYQSRTSDYIRRWREAGHLFGIVTGRDIRMTREAVEDGEIPVDFLICNNGCVLYDHRYREIHSEKIPLRVVKKMIRTEAVKRSTYIVLADDRGRYVYDNEYVPEKYTSVYYTDVLNEDNIEDHPFFYQMDTRYKNAREMHEVAQLWQNEVGQYVTVNPNVATIDMTPPGVTKLTGLQQYIRLQALEEAEIITAGDGFNDVPMLEYYRGYTVESAVNAIKEKADVVVKNVEELITRELQQ